MSFGFSCPPCLRAANPGVCCYSRIWRFGGSSRCSGGNRAGPNSATRIVCCGSPSDGCGRNGRRGCFSANPKLSALGIGWVFICSGIGDPVPAAADPPLIANSSTSFGKCAPAIPHGAAHAFKPNWPNSELLYRIPPSVSIAPEPNAATKPERLFSTTTPRTSSPWTSLSSKPPPSACSTSSWS